MKKNLIIITLIFAMFLMVGCTTTKNSSLFESASSRLSYEMLSSIKMLESADSFTNTTLNLSASESEVLEKETVEKYLSMMEELLNENGGFSSEVKTSDKAEYAKLIEVTTNNLKSEKIVYKMYYNESEPIVKVDEDEEETTTVITGIAIVGDLVYTLEGRTQTETEIGEVESSSYFKVIDDEDNYVIVTEETETETNETEHEFTYTIVTDGKRTSKVSFSIEEENNEVSVEIKELTKDSKVSYEFNIEEIANTKYIHIKVKNGNTITRIRVNVVFNTQTNEYEYNYRYVEKPVNNN